MGCTHFLVEVEYAQLEVELNTPVMERLWRTLGARDFFMKTEGIPEVEECIARLARLP